MLKRYSHACNERKQAAIATALGKKPVEAQSEEQETATKTLSLQNRPLSEVESAVTVM